MYNRLFLDTRTNKKIKLFEALGKSYIVMKEELYNNYEDSQIKNINLKSDIYLLKDNTLKSKQNDVKLIQNFEQQIQQHDILTIFDPRTGNQIDLNKAIEIGLFEPKTNKYIDIDRNQSMQLEEAIHKGMIVLKPECIKNSEDYQFLHINGILNPLTKKEMQLNEAIQSGILNYVECEVNDPESGQTLTLLEAYEKGILITSTKNTTLSLAPKKILKDTSNTSNEKRHSLFIEKNKQLDTINDFRIKNKSSTLPPKSRKPMKVLNDTQTNNNDDIKRSMTVSEKTIPKSQSQSPLRNSRNKRNNSSDRITSRGKLFFI